MKRKLPLTLGELDDRPLKRLKMSNGGAFTTFSVVSGGTSTTPSMIIETNNINNTISSSSSSSITTNSANKSFEDRMDRLSQWREIQKMRTLSESEGNNNSASSSSSTTTSATTTTTANANGNATTNTTIAADGTSSSSANSNSNGIVEDNNNSIDKQRQLALQQALQAKKEQESKIKSEYNEFIGKMKHKRHEIEEELNQRIAKMRERQKEKEKKSMLLKSNKKNKEKGNAVATNATTTTTGDDNSNNNNNNNNKDTNNNNNTNNNDNNNNNNDNSNEDPLDAYMSQLEAEMNVNKKSTKEKEDILWNDESVFDENDPMFEGEDNLENMLSLGNTNSKKEVASVDHSKITYEPFRKHLYVVAPEIARMTDAEVDAYREQSLEQCKVVGRDCPRPIMKWTQCGFPQKIMACLQHFDYTKPFPIQCQALPAIMSGRDVIASAKTGSGKTLAFVLPMLRHILDQRPVKAGEGPIALILAPTRELASQIFNETRRFARPLELSCSAVYGGAPVSEQIATLRRGSEIVVATPGRMIDMLCTNQGRLVNLQRVTYLVLDEADRMFDLGFEPQIHAIIKNIRPDRQTVMFSATFPKPIEKMAKQILTDPIQIVVGNVSTVCEDVIQCVQVLDNEEQKFEALLRLLSQWYGKGNILIFMDKREAVDMLYKKLQDNGYFSLVLHGGVDQTDRDFTILEFKNKRRTILISTSIAARGLDVKDLKVVINYTAPHHYEDYVHRVGRTGRAGTRGVAYTLLIRDEGRYAADIVKAMTRSNQGHNIPEELRQMVREFQDSVNCGEEKVFRNRGFHTKGYKFDETEALQKQIQIERQKLVYGNTQEISDWDLLPENKDAPTNEEPSSASATSNESKSETQSEVVEEVSTGNRLDKEVERMKKALKIATKLVNRKEDMEKIKDSVSRAMNVEKRKQDKETKARVAKVAQMITNQLNSGANTTPHEGDANANNANRNATTSSKYHTITLDINDFPERVRRWISSRNTYAHIMENYDVKITPKGTYVPPGKNAKGQERMHLIIDGRDERDAELAIRELKQMVNDEMRKTVTKHGNVGTYGKFAVI